MSRLHHGSPCGAATGAPSYRDDPGVALPSRPSARSVRSSSQSLAARPGCDSRTKASSSALSQARMGGPHCSSLLDRLTAPAGESYLGGASPKPPARRAILVRTFGVQHSLPVGGCVPPGRSRERGGTRTPWSYSRSRTSTGPAISRTRSRCSREPFRRMRYPSRCSSTRLDGRARPSRFASAEARAATHATTGVLTGGPRDIHERCGRTYRHGR